jgi:hypothetical protein
MEALGTLGLLHIGFVLLNYMFNRSSMRVHVYRIEPSLGIVTHFSLCVNTTIDVGQFLLLTLETNTPFFLFENRLLLLRLFGINSGWQAYKLYDVRRNGNHMMRWGLDAPTPVVRGTSLGPSSQGYQFLSRRC